jgi:glycosyltransferase involved in cell wall biosynthesis
MKKKKKSKICPLVSVIMPNYNNSIFISEAIESILNQSYTNFEFIIVDDCSRDNSWEIIKKYAKKDKRIKAFRNKRNLKIVNTRNKGFELIDKKSKYVAIFDSDDISLQNRLELQVNFLEKNRDYGAVGGHTYLINENSKRIGFRKYICEFKKLKQNILFRSPFAQPTVMIRAQVLEKVGYYSSDGLFDRARDFDLWVRIFDEYKIINLDNFLIEYRISSTQGKKTHLKETLLSTIQVQKKWLFKLKYFNILLLGYILLEYILLLFPENLILWLFKKITYGDRNE